MTQEQIEMNALDYANQQGVNYPIEPSYKAMIFSQIKEAYIAGVNSATPQGMKWVKASERLPEKVKQIKDDTGVIFRHIKSRQTEDVYTSITHDIAALLGGDIENWEWLDESSPAPVSDAVAFAEWIARSKWKRKCPKKDIGKWYVPAAGYGGGEPMMFTIEELYQQFKQSPLSNKE